MKTLIILALVLGIIAVYFVFNTEKSISIKGANDVVPAGIDIAKLIFNKVLDQSDKISSVVNSGSGINTGGISQSGLTEQIKSRIKEISSVVSDKAVNLIKKPIENKVNQLFCPQR